MAHITVNTPARTGLIAGILSAATNIKVRYQKYQVFRSTLSELQELSDRELADLGLSRTTIRRAAYKAAYG